MKHAGSLPGLRPGRHGSLRRASFPRRRSLRLRGIACPLNWVKAKLMLEEMAGGDALSLLLDEKASGNVPESAERDGHTVLSVTAEGDR